ncbi:right-handed parallel beta-helix repeat-containing protein [Candidatus Woesearchaeota archaeon]|nr:right-handed parallel beta-helix repeat-containing protein [Candidatus Woesearchaeota archaeon]
MKKGFLIVFLLFPVFSCALCEPPSSGNWLINESVECNDTDIILRGDLTVNSTLILRNTTLQMNSSSNGQFRITVLNNSELYILNDSVIESNTSARYEFLVLEGSHIEIIDSRISDAGYANANTRFGLEVYSDNNLFLNSDFINNYMGLTFIGANNNTVDNCTIAYSGAVGLQMLYDNSQNRIYNNDIYNYSDPAYGYGIDMEFNTSNNNFSSNNIYNFKYGVFFYSQCNDNTFNNNEIHHNEEGLHIESSEGNQFFKDTISYNEDPNAVIFQSDNTYFEGCGFYNDTNPYVFDRTNIQVVSSNNTIFNSSHIGSHLPNTIAYLLDVETSPVTYFYDSTFFSTQYYAWFTGNSDIFFINGSIPTTSSAVWFGDDFSTMYRQYYLDVQANYSDNYPADSTNINITDSFDSLAHQGVTDSQGQLSDVALTYFTINHSSGYTNYNYAYYSPYTIFASNGINAGNDTIGLAGNNQSFITLYDITPPSITLIHPINLLTDIRNISFRFSVNDTSSIKNCSLYINSTYQSSIQDPATQTTLTINQSLGLGAYNWSIYCIDGYNNSAWSSTAFFNITDQDSDLIIWDDSSSATYPNTQIHFYADYSNLSDGSSINDSIGECRILFADLDGTMAYDNISLIYGFNRSFPAEGDYRYDIECNSTIFFPRSLSGDLTVNKEPVVEGSGSRGGSSPLMMKGGTGSDSTTGSYFDLSDSTAKQGSFFRINFNGITYHLSLLRTDGVSAFFILEDERFSIEKGDSLAYDIDMDSEEDIIIELVDIVGDEVILRITPGTGEMDKDQRIAEPAQPGKTPQGKVGTGVVDVPLPGPVPEKDPLMAIIGIAVIFLLTGSVGYYLLFVKKIV